jgi:ADP-dependent NAD(P)H-hydrate dehydratase
MDTPLTAALLRSWPLPLPADGDKRARGTVLVVGGSPETPGAVLLAGLAALRAGAGRIQLVTCAEAAPSLAAALPEALVRGLATTREGGLTFADDWESLRTAVSEADALLIGPGLADLPATTALTAHLLDHVSAQAIVVLDALAIAVLPTIGSRLDPLCGRLVLTPNAQEVHTIAPDVPGNDQPGRQAAAAAQGTGAVVTLHGHVAAPDGRSWTAAGGGIGLGTSGSGDVLAGFAAGLAARCGDATQAACWATHLHHAAGDRLSTRIGTVGFLAREIADEGPRVLDALNSGAGALSGDTAANVGGPKPRQHASTAPPPLSR